MMIDVPKNEGAETVHHDQGLQREQSQEHHRKVPNRPPYSRYRCLGSGKSTLVYETLYKGMMQIINKSRDQAGKHDKIVFDAEIDKVIVIDQSPIERPRGPTLRPIPRSSTRSVRSLPDEGGEAAGLCAGPVLIQHPGGRCEACEGDGLIKIEMNFLPDVYIECEECKGKRYNRETLEVLYKGKSIADVLNMSVEEAMKHFENIPSIRTKLETLSRVGLDYIKLARARRPSRVARRSGSNSPGNSRNGLPEDPLPPG